MSVSVNDQITAETIARLRADVEEMGPLAMHLASADELVALLAAAERAQELEAEVERLKAITGVCMGVGDGSGRLFVYGDYDSIKAAQRNVFRAEAAEQALEQAKLQIQYLHEKFGETGSGNGVLAQIDAVLSAPSPDAGWRSIEAYSFEGCDADDGHVRTGPWALFYEDGAILSGHGLEDSYGTRIFYERSGRRIDPSHYMPEPKPPAIQARDETGGEHG